MTAWNDVVRSGKVRYIGASSMYAWQFAKAQQVAKEHGWAQFVTMQNLYNLIYREEEREMIPLLADQKVGQIVWSPQAKGRLARKPGTVTTRYDNEAVGKRFFPEDESNLEIIHRADRWRDQNPSSGRSLRGCGRHLDGRGDPIPRRSVSAARDHRT